jgi:hypothetical protein
VRTTITVPDALLIEVKQLAAARRTSVTAIVVESLRRHLTHARREMKRTVATLPVLKQAKPRPGIDLDDTSALLDLD